ALQPVDAVSGALMLLPRALFERVGGFDAWYRLHAEDLDLCRRVREAGAIVAVANDIRVLHLRGVSSRARPLFVEWHKHRGLWRYFTKFEAPRRSLPTRAAAPPAPAACSSSGPGTAACRATSRSARPPAARSPPARRSSSRSGCTFRSRWLDVFFRHGSTRMKDGSERIEEYKKIRVDPF